MTKPIIVGYDRGGPTTPRSNSAQPRPSSPEHSTLTCWSEAPADTAPSGGVLLGSGSRRVVREAHCPVMVLPRGVGASLEELLSEAPAAASA